MNQMLPLSIGQVGSECCYSALLYTRLSGKTESSPRILSFFAVSPILKRLMTG
jgi:hypothetical protein